MQIDRNHGAPLPRELSRFQDKLDIYAADTYFRESWEDYLATGGKEPPIPLSQFAAITLKPDAVVGRTLKPTMEWLADKGFEIVAAELVEFDRHITRGIWHYSWNVASRDRKDVVDILLPATPSLFLALHGRDDAALWLSENKGPANPRYRQPGQLRYGLGDFSTLLNFVHTSDEPADFVRELAVYFPASIRLRIYEAMSAPEDFTSRAETLAGELEARFPPHDLKLEASLNRVRDFGDDHLDGAIFDLAQLRRLIGEIENRESRDWRRLFSLVEHADIPCDLWDLIVIATNLVAMDNPDVDPVLQGVSSMSLPTTATEIG